MTHADVVVLGSGIAGLCAALECEGLNVHVFTKATLHSGASSFWAQGGLAAAIADYDSPKLHAADTIIAGAGLSDLDVTNVLTDEARAAVQFLSEVGTRFDLDEDGNFALAREGAHQVPRVLHANHDATGQELMRALALAASKAPHITLHERSRALEIVVDDQGAVCGLIYDSPDGIQAVQTRRMVLATGGSGQLFRFTTNPPEACGEGLSLAARAGAVLTDMEFVQFHPTALKTTKDPLPLITEALRGEGAWLVNGVGERFMLGVHDQGELAPRDVVSRGVAAELARGSSTFLDSRSMIGDRFPELFPNVFKSCMEMGVDPRVDLIPVVPAAHYHMGGVAVDLEGQSTVPGLWACGEVSSTGVHGANRLASNSLLEAVVFGKRVAESVRSAIVSVQPFGLDGALARQLAASSGEAAGDDVMAMRQLMWDQVGLSREAAGLQQAVERFREVYLARRDPAPLRDRAWIGWAMAEAALGRRESRGAHFRSDFPKENLELKRHSRVIWEEDAKAWRLEFQQDLIPIGS